MSVSWGVGWGEANWTSLHRHWEMHSRPTTSTIYLVLLEISISLPQSSSFPPLRQTAELPCPPILCHLSDHTSLDNKTALISWRSSRICSMKLLTDPSTLTWDFPCDENYLEDIVFIFHQEEGDHLPDKRIKNPDPRNINKWLRPRETTRNVHRNFPSYLFSIIYYIKNFK